MGPDRVARIVIGLVAAAAAVLAAVLVVLAAAGEEEPDGAPPGAAVTAGAPEGPAGAGAGGGGPGGAMTDAAAPGAVRRGYPLIFESLNGSGITGTGAVTPGPGRRLTVVFGLTGLTPGVAHPQAIHEPAGQAADLRCPGPGDDVDGDGLLSAREGEGAYGPARLELRPYPEADGGRVGFRGVYALPRSRRPPIDGAVVIHAAGRDGAGRGVPIGCALITPG